MRRRRCSSEVEALPNSKTNCTASLKSGSFSSGSELEPSTWALVLGRFEEALDVLGLSLRLPEADHRGGLLFADKRRVQAHQAAGSGRQKEHIAAAQQRLRSVGVEDGARIDLGGQAEADAGGDVGLDEAGDDVHRGPLRGQDEMNADGAGHLRQAGDRLLDVRAVEHHQVGQFVDDDDDVGERLSSSRRRRRARA
jgi:hypothetical protein